MLILHRNHIKYFDSHPTASYLLMIIFAIVVTIIQTYESLLNGALFLGLAIETWSMPTAFILLPAVALLAALGTTVLKQPVQNLLCLITVFFTTVLLYLFAGAEFLSFVFLIVYVGAIAILFLFVIMLLNLRVIATTKQVATSALPLLFASFVVLILVGMEDAVALTLKAFIIETAAHGLTADATMLSGVLNYVNHRATDILLFTELYTEHASLFMLSAFLLLTALLGSIVLATSATADEFSGDINNKAIRMSRPLNTVRITTAPNRPLSQVLSNHVFYYPTPSQLNYNWSFVSLVGLFFALQIVTGGFLAMHYTPHVEYAFESVEHIMSYVNGGSLLSWLFETVHAAPAEIEVRLHSKPFFVQLGGNLSPRTAQEFAWMGSHYAGDKVPLKDISYRVLSLAHERIALVTHGNLQAAWAKPQAEVAAELSSRAWWTHLFFTEWDCPKRIDVPHVDFYFRDFPETIENQKDFAVLSACLQGRTCDLSNVSSKVLEATRLWLEVDNVWKAYADFQTFSNKLFYESWYRWLRVVVNYGFWIIMGAYVLIVLLAIALFYERRQKAKELQSKLLRLPRTAFSVGEIQAKFKKSVPRGIEGLMSGAPSQEHKEYYDILCGELVGKSDTAKLTREFRAVKTYEFVQADFRKVFSISDRVAGYFEAEERSVQGGYVTHMYYAGFIDAILAEKSDEAKNFAEFLLDGFVYSTNPKQTQLALLTKSLEEKRKLLDYLTNH